MKAKHRHELETNELAKRLAVVIERVQPYSSTIVGVLIAVAVAFLGYSYLSGSTAARKSEAWNSYNQAVLGLIPDMELLKQSAEANTGTAMQELADVTWADGQVWMASREILQNRSAALESLSRATTSYEGVISSSDDQDLIDRARFGLARVYELRDELDKAREQYAAIRGSFAELAALRAEQLAKNQTRQDCAWLAKAEAPRRAPPPGPGTPGEAPRFAPDELSLPGDSAEGEVSIDELLEGIAVPGGAIDVSTDDSGDDRYGTESDESANSAEDEAAPPVDSSQDADSP